MCVYVYTHAHIREYVYNHISCITRTTRVYQWERTCRITDSVSRAKSRTRHPLAPIFCLDNQHATVSELKLTMRCLRFGFESVRVNIRTYACMLCIHIFINVVSDSETGTAVRCTWRACPRPAGWFYSYWQGHHCRRVRLWYCLWEHTQELVLQNIHWCQQAVSPKRLSEVSVLRQLRVALWIHPLARGAPCSATACSADACPWCMLG